MSRPLVSIVTPSLNQGWSIEDAILSVKAQTYPNIEHIIVDGGSTDQTLDVIRRHEGSYDMRWRSEADEGMYDAVNKGLRLARGDILAYLNCDDFYPPWAITTAVRHLQQHDIVFGDSITWDLRHGVTRLRFTPPFSDDFYRTVAITQPAVFFRRSLYERVGPFDQSSFKLIADWEYWLRCAAIGFRPQKVYEFLAVERLHEEAQHIAKLQQMEQEVAQLRKRYPCSSVFGGVLSAIVKRVYCRLALGAYKVGWPPVWMDLKHSNAAGFGWGRCFLEILPLAIVNSLRLPPLVDVGSLLARPLGVGSSACGTHHGRWEAK